MRKVSDSVMHSDPCRLAELMDTQAGAGGIWHPNELAAVLRHQLATPIRVDLGHLKRHQAALVEALASAQGLLLKSMADLLFHPQPPIELLRLTKDFAKACRTSPDRSIPHEIATFLYFSSIAVAAVRCRQRISKLTDGQLREGLDWILRQPWVDERSRSLCAECLAATARGAEAGTGQARASGWGEGV